MKRLLTVMILASLVTACNREAMPFDQFAQCLTDKNIVMYGSDTCPHCQAQKNSFKGSFDMVTFIECNRNPAECQEAEIQAYPTWIFPDGERHEGRMSLSELSEKSGCELAATPTEDDTPSEE